MSLFLSSMNTFSHTFYSHPRGQKKSFPNGQKVDTCIEQHIRESTPIELEGSWLILVFAQNSWENLLSCDLDAVFSHPYAVPWVNLNSPRSWAIYGMRVPCTRKAKSRRKSRENLRIRSIEVPFFCMTVAVLVCPLLTWHSWRPEASWGTLTVTKKQG